MTENLIPSTSLPETVGSPAGDSLRKELEIGYFCAVDNQARQKALNSLEKDRLRAVMAGMTPEQRQFWAGVDSVPWDKVKEGGQAAGEVILPALLGFKSAEYLSPEAGKNLAVIAMAGSVGMEALALGVYKAEKIAKKHPRAAVLAQALTLSRLFLSHGGTALGSFGLGLGGAEIRDAIGRLQGFEQIVTPASAGGGEGFNNPHPIHRPVVEASGEFGALQPPADVATANEATQAAQAAAQQAAADTARMQVAEALKESQLAAAPVGITGGELAGGTIWGNELEFVKQLGVHHVEPVTNLLKNFSKVLAQAQPPTEIGPTDTAYVINRNVAGWAAGQADKLYGMDPSSMTSWQKALWEIGRGLREANWRDLQAVTEEFVRQAKP